MRMYEYRRIDIKDIRTKLYNNTECLICFTLFHLALFWIILASVNILSTVLIV